ncbi:MAG TPA: hypothetical protein VLA77_04535 [Candidatus Saccharimonadales bacterium]|nr:hypothetical protein [Candidatus Saccharimonadales bacterium]
MKWWFKKQQPRQPNLMDGQNGYVFRRSRTLTGSTSEKVAPTAEKTGQLKTDRLKSHERKARLKTFAKSAASWAGVFAILMYMFAMYIKNPQIVFAPASNMPNVDVYKKTINDFMAKTPLQHFGFTISQDEVNEYVKSAHSEVDDVYVNRNWYGGNLEFDLEFRKPLIVWKAGNQNFYVDKDGEAFIYNHFEEPGLVVTDQSGIRPDEGGGAVASSRFIRFLGQLIGAVESYELGKVTEVVIPPSTREIHLKLEGREYAIKTHIDRDPVEQAEDIYNAIKYFDAKGIKPQYLDVRVAHKAYYK